MVIEIEVTNNNCKILNKLDLGQLAVIQDLCSFEVEGSEFKSQQFRNKNIEWDGRRKLFDVRNQKFPIGLLPKICDMLNVFGIKTQIISKRNIIDESINYYIQNIGIRQYQTDAVTASIINGNGIIKVATGGGKTSIAARTIDAIGKKSIFVVHTRDLLYQTIESFQRVFPNETIGQIGDGKIDYQNITVATMQTLSILGKIEFSSYKFDEDSDKYKETYIPIKEDIEKFHKYRHSVSVVMFDEVQRICSRTAYSARFLFDNANYAFGYSASPWRDDGSDLMIEAAFGKRIVDVDASSLIDQGFLVQPTINVYDSRSNIWEGKTYEQVYKSAIVENMFRNMQVSEDAYNQYKMGRNTLVLVTQIKHGEILEDMLNGMGAPAVFISGKSGIKKRKQVISDMRNGKAPIVIASTIADVGLDVPRLQSLVEAGAGKSSVTALQRLGRIMRPFEGKDKCYYITYRDKVPYIRSHIDRKMEIWRTEKNFIINDYGVI